MGIFKKAKRLVKKPRKLIKKLIPKEIRPFVPYIAAAMGPAGLAQSGIFANPAVTKALIAGGAKFATDDEADLKDIGITAALAASPDLLKQGGEGIGAKFGKDATIARQAASAANTGSFFVPETAEIGRVAQAADKVASVASKIPTLGEAGSLGTEAKLVGGLGAVDATRKLAEIEQDELDRYNRELQDKGIRSRAERRAAIRNIYTGIGYDEDYVDSMLDRFGYKEGGKAKKAAMTLEEFIEEYYKPREMELAGGGITNMKRGMVNESGSYSGDVAAAMAFRDLMKTGRYTPEEASKIAKEISEDDEEEISKYADLAEEGFKSALGVESLFPQAPKPMGITPGFGNLPRMADGGDVMSPEEYFKGKEKFKKRKDIDDMMKEYEEYLYRQKYGPRDSAAEGGLMNLGGNEMDLRGGGFVPIGKKEKADDVPARLSKNEFVMTADAVRGAGGGDVNEGARRMYQTMDELEAMA